MDISLTESQQNAWRILIKSHLETLGFSQKRMADHLGKTEAEKDSWQTRLSQFVNGESKVLNQVFGKERYLAPLAKGLQWSPEMLRAKFDEVRGLETQDPEGTARIAGCETRGPFSANRVHVPLGMARFSAQMPNAADERLRSWGRVPVSAEELLRYLGFQSGLAVLVVVPKEMGKTLLLHALAELLQNRHQDFAWWHEDEPPEARVLLVDNVDERPGCVPTLRDLIKEQQRLVFMVASAQPNPCPFHPCVLIHLQPPDATWAAKCLRAHAALLKERLNLVVDADLLIAKLNEFAPSNSWMTPRTLGLLIHDAYLGDTPDPKRPVHLLSFALASSRRRLAQLQLKAEETWLRQHGKSALIRWSCAMAIPEPSESLGAQENQVLVALARVGLVKLAAGQPVVRHRALALASVARQVVDQDFEASPLLERLTIDPEWQDVLIAAIRSGPGAGKRAGEVLRGILAMPASVRCLAMGLLTRLLGEPIDAAYEAEAMEAQQQVLSWWWRLSDAKQPGVPWAQLARTSLCLKHLPAVSKSLTKPPLPKVLERYLDSVTPEATQNRSREDFLALAAPFQTARSLDRDFWEKVIEWTRGSDVGWVEDVTHAEGKAWLDVVVERLETGGKTSLQILRELVVFAAGAPGQRSHWKRAFAVASGPELVSSLALAAQQALLGPAEDMQVLEEVRRQWIRGPLVDALGKELGKIVLTHPNRWVQRPVLQWALTHCDDESRDRAWDSWLERGPDVPWHEFMVAGLQPKRIADWALGLRLGGLEPGPKIQNFNEVRNALVEQADPEALIALAVTLDPWAIQKLRTDPKCRAERLRGPWVGALFSGLETSPSDEAALEKLVIDRRDPVVRLLAGLHLARLRPSAESWSRAHKALDELEAECKTKRWGTTQNWSRSVGEAARLTALAAQKSPAEGSALCRSFLQRPVLRSQILEHVEFWSHALPLLSWTDVITGLREGHHDRPDEIQSVTEIRVRGLILCGKGKDLEALVDDPQLGQVIGVELAKRGMADADSCERILAGFDTSTRARTILAVLQALIARAPERGTTWLAQPKANLPRSVLGEVLRTLPVEKQLEVLKHWEQEPSSKGARSRR
jgi:hypothetical protein